MRTLILAALAAVALTTVTGQLLIPLAGDLATEDQRGRVVGTVVSGVLSGILLSRTLSGLIAGAFGWRAVYGVAAIVTAAMAMLLARVLPTLPPRASVPYAHLLASVFAAVGRHRAVQVTLAISASAFAVFTDRGGWIGVSLGGAALIAFALVVWLTQRGRALAVPVPRVA